MWYYVIGSVTSIITTLGIVMVMVSYRLNRKTQLSKEKENAITIASKYAENFRYMRVIFRVQSKYEFEHIKELRKYLKKFTYKHCHENKKSPILTFTREECNKILGREFKYREEVISKLQSDPGKLRMIYTTSFPSLEDSAARVDGDILAEKYVTLQDTTLDKLETISMNFNTKVADENAIFDSMHHTFLELIEILYTRIAFLNRSSSRSKRYYGNIIDLYNRWKVRCICERRPGVLDFTVPSIFTHLAIAKSYAERSGVENMQEFYDGSVLPDLTENKENSHYGSRKETKNIIKRHVEKVNLGNFLEAVPLDTELALGRFLHLYTDWSYYNGDLISKDYLKKVSPDQYSRDMLYTSYHYDGYLQEKYGLSLEMTSHKDYISKLMKWWEERNVLRWGREIPQGNLLFTQEALDKFIQEMASVNLHELSTRLNQSPSERTHV